jgi:hypothetical protein
MNTGKLFEELIKDSCFLQNIACIRLKDAGYTGEQTTRRFTVTNICDFILYDGQKMLLLEAKSSKGKSISISRLKQLVRLADEQNKVFLDNYKAGFIFEFSEHKYYYSSVERLDKIISDTTKKSINMDELEGIEIELYVPTGKRKARLNLKKMFDKI